MLRGIIHSLNAVESECIVFENDHYILHEDLKVTEPVRRITRELGEIGWLFNKISEFQEHESNGVIRKALKMAIHEENKEYFRWLAVVEGMMKTEELTLRKMVLWTSQPFEKMKWLEH